MSFPLKCLVKFAPPSHSVEFYEKRVYSAYNINIEQRGWILFLTFNSILHYEYALVCKARELVQLRPFTYYRTTHNTVFHCEHSRFPIKMSLFHIEYAFLVSKSCRAVSIGLLLGSTLDVSKVFHFIVNAITRKKRQITHLNSQTYYVLVVFRIYLL